MAFYEALQNASKSHNGDFSNGNIVFIKDGFCWPAFFFTPFWLIFRGMWLVLVFYLGLSMIFWALEAENYISSDAASWVQLGLSLLFAFEANFLRKWTLQRDNYRHIGVSLGRNLKEAEVSFFEQFISGKSTSEVLIVEPAVAVANIVSASVSEQVVNPISTVNNVEHQKSHWKVGGRRKADSVVGMFNDD